MLDDKALEYAVATDNATTVLGLNIPNGSTLRKHDHVMGPQDVRIAATACAQYAAGRCIPQIKTAHKISG